MRHLENGDGEKAVKSKLDLEQRQRDREKQRQSLLPIWFSEARDAFNGQRTWISNGKYWSAKDNKFRGHNVPLNIFQE